MAIRAGSSPGRRTAPAAARSPRSTDGMDRQLECGIRAGINGCQARHLQSGRATLGIGEEGRPARPSTASPLGASSFEADAPRPVAGEQLHRPLDTGPTQQVPPPRITTLDFEVTYLGSFQGHLSTRPPRPDPGVIAFPAEADPPDEHPALDGRRAADAARRARPTIARGGEEANVDPPQPSDRGVDVGPWAPPGGGEIADGLFTPAARAAVGLDQELAMVDQGQFDPESMAAVQAHDLDQRGRSPVIGTRGGGQGEHREQGERTQRSPRPAIAPPGHGQPAAQTIGASK